MGGRTGKSISHLERKNDTSTDLDSPGFPESFHTVHRRIICRGWIHFSPGTKWKRIPDRIRESKDPTSRKKLFGYGPRGSSSGMSCGEEQTLFQYVTPITIVTDHKTLATWFTQDLPENRRRARWILKMNQYNFTIRHRQGRSLAHVDYLSRNPINKVRFKEDTN